MAIFLKRIMSKHLSHTMTARLALLVLGLIWGSTFVVVSSTAEFFKPGCLIAMRFSIGFVLLSLIFIGHFKKFNKAYILASILSGVTTFFGYYTQAYAMTELGGKPGRVAFLVATYCVVVPFASWLFNHKKPDIFNIIAAVMCIIGVGLISLPDLLAQRLSVSIADFFALLSSLIFVFNIIIVERMAPQLDTPLFTICHFFVAAILAICFTVCFEDNSRTVWSARSIFTLLYLAVPCTALAMLLQTFGQKYTSASTAALFFSLESVFGITFSVLFGFEKLTANLVIGGLLIVLSIIVTETKLKIR